MGRFPDESGPSAAAKTCTGTCTAPTVSASMLDPARPDGEQELPSWLTQSHFSVAARAMVRRKANPLTTRPSRPVAADHVAPPSVLSKAPAPRVPARTRPGLYGLNAMVVGTPLPLCFEVQVEPPSALLSNEPSELPAISASLFDGSTAKAKMADRPW